MPSRSAVRAICSCWSQVTRNPVGASLMMTPPLQLAEKTPSLSFWSLKTWFSRRSFVAPSRPSCSCIASVMASSRLVQPETDLDRDLPVGHLTVGEVAADLGHLEPVDVAQSLVRPAHGVADGVVDAVRRGAHDLGDAVDVVGHGSLLRVRGQG